MRTNALLGEMNKGKKIMPATALNSWLFTRKHWIILQVAGLLTYPLSWTAFPHSSSLWSGINGPENQPLSDNGAGLQLRG